MRTYRFFNVVIESNIEFGFGTVGDSRPDLTFRLLHKETTRDASCRTIREVWSPDGALWFTLYRCKSNLRIHFPEYADFILWDSDSRIDCRPEKDVSLHTVIHLFLDQVLPMFLSHKGCVVLHGSGIVVSNKASIFLGETQSGKSTLAASFGNEGFYLLTDDSLLIRDGNPVMAIGGYQGLRLWPDSMNALAPNVMHSGKVAHYSDKLRLNVSHQFCDMYVPVENLYVLSLPQNSETSGQIAIESLQFRERVHALLESAFRLDITDRERNAREFETLSGLAERLPMFRLSYPRRYEMLPLVRGAILAHVDQLASRTT